MPDLTFKYKPGKSNEATDTLSSASVSTEEKYLSRTVLEITPQTIQEELLQKIQSQTRRYVTLSALLRRKSYQKILRKHRK